METQNGDGFGFQGFLGHCGWIQECFTFQCGSQSVERVPKMYQVGCVHRPPQLGEQPTYIHQELGRTRGCVKDSLQHLQNEEFVQIYFCLLRVFYMQDAKRR